MAFDFKGKITDFLTTFKPAKGYFITPILININLLVFIAMAVSGVNILQPENQDLLNWGANFRPMVAEGQRWRLLTACFLHIGILHLMLNMYALHFIGSVLEPYLGKARFLATYLILGIAGNLTSIWWFQSTISAGASGAIFGLYGTFLALLTTNLIDKSVKTSIIPGIIFFIAYNVFYGLRPNSGIDNAAHLGGLFCGIVIGYAWLPCLKQYDNTRMKYSTITVLSIVLLVSSIIVFRYLPNDIAKYEKQMYQFVSMESMALEVFQLPAETPRDKILSEINNRGLYYWKENIKLLKSFKDLDLPWSVRVRNKKLIKYCELRIKSYRLLYKAVEEDTDKYNDELNQYNRELEAIIRELTGNQ